MSHIVDTIGQPINVGDMAICVLKNVPRHGVCVKLSGKQGTFTTLHGYRIEKGGISHTWHARQATPHGSWWYFAGEFELDHILKALTKQIMPIEIPGMDRMVLRIRTELDKTSLSIGSSSIIYSSKRGELHNYMSDEEIAMKLFEFSLVTKSFNSQRVVKI